MQITISINCDNAAFVPEPQPEIARILRGLALEILHGENPDKVYDENGNFVGTLVVTD